MTRKVNLTESQIRRIVRKVIIRNENPYLNEVKEEQASEESPAEESPAEESTSAPESKTYKYEDLIKQTGSVDNLAIQNSGAADRVADIGKGAVTAAAVTGGVGGIIGATTAAEFTIGAVGTAAVEAFGTVAGSLTGGPLGIGVLIVAGAAGLYYLFTPTTTTSKAVDEALDTTLHDRVYTGFEAIYRELKKSEFPEIVTAAEKMNPKTCLKVPGSNEAAKIAKKIYTATQGGSFTGTFTGGSGLFGLGTDEDAIAEALKECGSFLGVSLVSKKHAEMYKGRFFDDANLANVLGEELDPEYMELYVTSVVEGLPYIIINDKSFTKTEFQDWLVANKKAADDLIAGLKEDLDNQEEENVEQETNTEDVVPPFVELIQRSINRYCAKNGLDYVALDEDNKWGPKTEALWKSTYIPHVFKNHPDFSKMNISIGDSKWANLSAQLIDTYPGYTSGAKGCARFCVDALYGNTVQGQKEGTDDTPIKYIKGGKKRRRVEPEPERGDPEPLEREETDYQPLGDGRLTYKNIKIDVDAVGDRNIRKLSQLPGAASDSDSELKYDFLTNFGTGRLDVPAGQTFQLHIMPKKDGKIKFQHKSTKLFKALGIRTFADPFYRFFQSLNLSDANIKKLTMNGKSPIIIKVIMPGGLYNPAVER